MEEPRPRRVLTKRHQLVALLACGSLAATVVGRLSSCAGCDYEILGIPFFAIGSVFYLALVLLALLGIRPSLIGWISLPGLAFQAGLVRFLLAAATPCPSCLLAAGLLFTLSLVCLWPAGKWRLAPAAVALAGIVSLPLWSGLLAESERVPGLPEFARAADLRSPPEDATLMVVYEREACSFCRSFRNEYQPRLSVEFGAALVIRRVDAKDRKGLRRLPTFLIRSSGGSLTVVRGLAAYSDLATQIRRAAERN
jgi:hypothetical protein